MIKNKVKTLRKFDRSATRYPYTIFDLSRPYFYRKSKRRLKNILKESDTKKANIILDVGCGTGYFTSLFKGHFTHVVGLDLSKNMIKVAKKSFEHVGMYETTDFLIADGEFLPFKNYSFDTTFCIDFLHHVNNVSAIIEEMLRATVSGGKFAAIEPNFFNPLYAMFCIIVSEESLRNFVRASKNRLKKILHINNIKNIEIYVDDFIPPIFLKFFHRAGKLLDILESSDNLLIPQPAQLFLSSHFTIIGRKQ
ncbi:MAG: class I SAM-dependent methyltransferase [Thermoplasmatales archaeon]|nr:MAG: class I SAM-dependent methyltransferase [Thermoplasmatales archaeon]